MAENEKVIIYTAPTCGVCDDAKREMRAEGIEFEERDVMREQKWFDDVLKYTIFVPLIFRGEKMEIGWKGAVG
jgi:glutaredoxin